jgi:hypothetical protein
MAYTIKMPHHAYQFSDLAGLSFGNEQTAVNTLIKVFTKGCVDFQVRRTAYGKVFFNTLVGELASVVSSPGCRAISQE